MPLAVALKSFKGRYGHIRAGTTFNAEPGYFRQLAKKQWVKLADETPTPEPGSKEKTPPGPGEDRSKGAPPNKAGKGQRGAGKPPAPKKGGKGAKDTAPPPGAGKGATSASLRADLASRGKMPDSSENGGTSLENPDGEDLAAE